MPAHVGGRSFDSLNEAMAAASSHQRITVKGSATLTLLDGSQTVINAEPFWFCLVSEHFPSPLTPDLQECILGGLSRRGEFEQAVDRRPEGAASPGWVPEGDNRQIKFREFL